MTTQALWVVKRRALLSPHSPRMARLSESPTHLSSPFSVATAPELSCENVWRGGKTGIKLNFAVVLVCFVEPVSCLLPLEVYKASESSGSSKSSYTSWERGETLECR